MLVGPAGNCASRIMGPPHLHFPGILLCLFVVFLGGRAQRSINCFGIVAASFSDIAGMLYLSRVGVKFLLRRGFVWY